MILSGKTPAKGLIAFLAACIALGAAPHALRADDLSTVHDCNKEILIRDGGDLLTREERIMRLEQAFNESLTRFKECDTKSSADDADASASNAPQEQKEAGAESSSESAADADASASDAPQEQKEAGAESSSESAADADASASDAPQEQKEAGAESSSESAADAEAPVNDAPQEQRDAAAAPPVKSRGLSGEAPQEEAAAAPPPAAAPVKSRGLAGNEPQEQQEAAAKPPAATRHSPDDIPPAATDDAAAARLRQAAEAEQEPEKQVQLWNKYRRYKGLPEWLPHGGATPGDIPSANNDDVVAAQIRQAAEAEQDPQKRARLWNEYRRYKGLPEK